MTPAYECLLSKRENKDGEQQRFGPVFWPHGAGFWAALTIGISLIIQKTVQMPKVELKQ